MQGSLCDLLRCDFKGVIRYDSCKECVVDVKTELRMRSFVHYMYVFVIMDESETFSCLTTTIIWSTLLPNYAAQTT